MFSGAPFAAAPFAGATLDGPAPPSGPTTLRAAFRLLLVEAPAVAALCGGRVEYGASAQGEASPRLTFRVASRSAGRDLDGPDGTAEARLRVEVWADDPVEAEEVADAVREALDGFGGRVGSVDVPDVAFLREYDLPELIGDGSAGEVAQIVLDFEVDQRF